MMMIIPCKKIEQKACRCFESLVSWVCIARDCHTSLCALHVTLFPLHVPNPCPCVCTARDFAAATRPYWWTMRDFVVATCHCV